MGKIFALTIFIFGFVIVLFLYKDLAPFWLNDKNGIIYNLWKQDVEKLIVHQKIPKEWTKIKKIEYIPLTESSKKLISEIKAPIREHTDGQYLLQIKLDDWQEKEYYNLLIQYHLIHLESGNTVWELDRNLSAKVGTASRSTSKSDSPRPVESPSASPKRPDSRRSNPSEQQP